MAYPTSQSPLYKLRNRHRLCQLLRTDTSRLRTLRSGEEYRVYVRALKGKWREIEQPSAELSRVQAHIHSLLSRIEHPDWVYSGIRGRSYIGNAARHAGSPFVTTCDVHSFYQSANTEHVFRFFAHGLKQAEDIAWLLTDIVTFKGHLPTGSPSSPLVAFRAYEPAFRAIRDLALSQGAMFSLYVDDMTFSGCEPLRAGFLGEVRSILRCYGLELKDRKTRYFGPRSWKPITGVAISPRGDLAVPNRLAHSIYRSAARLQAGGLALKELEQLHGFLSSAQQIDPRYRSNLNRLVKAEMGAARVEQRLLSGGIGDTNHNLGER